MRTTFVRLSWGVQLMLLAILLSSCATLFNRPLQQVPVHSLPPAAEVFVDGAFVGMTPVTLQLERRSEHEVVLRLGDRVQSVTLRSGVDSTYVAVDIAPGLVTAAAGAVILMTTDFEGLSPLGRAIPGMAALGIVVGLSTAVVNVAVDAGTGRWYRLTPGEVLVVFD